MAKRKKSRKSAKRGAVGRGVSEMSGDFSAGRAKLDKEMSKAGIDYKKLAGAIITIIGVVLIVLNLTAVLLAFVGFVLVYFGIKMLGYNVHKALQS